MNRMLKTLYPLPALALVAGLSVAGTSHAQPWKEDTYFRGGSGLHSVADGNVVDVSIKVGGSNAPLFFRPGTTDRNYFQAFKGRNYSVVLHNTTGRRIGVLVAVDGINVVNGEKSNLGRDEAMYVLDPWETTEINGWRTSLSEVRRFVFVDEERSYATRTGQANGDLGWIRVLAFREVERRAWWDRYNSRGRIDGDDEMRAQEAPNAPAPSLGKSLPRENAAPQSRDLSDRRMAEGSGGNEDGNPGTGWGDRRYDPVERTEFRGERTAIDHLVFRYEYASGLRALGIVPRRPRTWEREHGELGFAQPPRW